MPIIQIRKLKKILCTEGDDSYDGLIKISLYRVGHESSFIPNKMNDQDDVFVNFFIKFPD